MLKVVCICIFILIVLAQDQATLKEIFSRPEFIAARKQHDEIYSKLKSQPEINFDCPRVPPQTPVPTNARNLRPSDIKVVMSLGDSITAGFAMVDDSYVTSVHEYRGKSGFMGVDNGTASLANYFKKVAGDIKGGSILRGLPWSAQPWGIRPNNPLIDHLNGAQSNARVEHLDHQVNYLIRQAKVEPGVDINKDWKMLTVLIGANNMCQCEMDASRPHIYESQLRAALTKLKANIPRVFVSLIPIFESGFNDVWRNGQPSTYCKLIWNVFRCPCMINSEESRVKASQLARDYNRIMLKLSQEFNAENKEDFYVTVQPMIQNLEIEDLSYTSKFDCFHPSVMANSLISINYWNSLQLPYERKPRNQVKPLRPICPTEATRLQ